MNWYVIDITEFLCLFEQFNLCPLQLLEVVSEEVYAQLVESCLPDLVREIVNSCINDIIIRFMGNLILPRRCLTVQLLFSYLGRSRLPPESGVVRTLDSTTRLAANDSQQKKLCHQNSGPRPDTNLSCSHAPRPKLSKSHSRMTPVASRKLETRALAPMKWLNPEKLNQLTQCETSSEVRSLAVVKVTMFHSPSSLR